MKKKIAVFSVIAAIACSLFAMPVYAQSDACDFYPEGDPNRSMICDKKTDEDATNTIKNILNAVYLYSGIIATIVIIIGGFFYIKSQGDPAKITTAKNTILYAVIGLVIILSAFAITNFIINAIGGTNGQSSSQSQQQPKNPE